MLDSEVVKVSKQEVVLKNGKSVHFDKLLLATGSKAKKWSFDDGKPGIYSLRNAEDLEKIQEYTDKNPPKTILIYGQSFIGTELASSCRANFENADIFTVGSQKYLYQNVFGEKVGESISQLAENNKVQNIQSKVKSIHQSGTERHVLLENG